MFGRKSGAVAGKTEKNPAPSVENTPTTTGETAQSPRNSLDGQEASPTDPSAPTSESSPTSATAPVEEQMLNAMDKLAARLMTIMSSDEVDDRGRPKFSLKEQINAFQMGENWLEKRKKFFRVKEVEQGGIALLRSIMDGSSVLKEYLDEQGYVRVPVKKNGRPNKEEAQVRERFKQAKIPSSVTRRPGAAPDDQLQRALKGR